MDKEQLIKGEVKKAKPRNRKEWIKNTIIVFLLVMLLLTFFSNTIMNHSLPEVSVSRLSRESVSKNYNLDIVVEANKTYDITSDEPRDIKRVAVKRGQEVKEGQALFYLEEIKDSAQVKELTTQIDAEKLIYEKAMMTAGADYYELNLGVEKARDALNKAISDKKNAASGGNVTVDNTARIAELTQKKATLQNDIALLSSQSYESLSSSTRQKMEAELNSYNSLKAEYDSLNASLQTLQTSFKGDDAIREVEKNIGTLELDLELLNKGKASEADIARKQLEIKYAKEDLERLKAQKTSIEDLQKKLNEKTPQYQNAADALATKALNVKASIESDSQVIDVELSSLQSSQIPSGGELSGPGIDYDAAISEAKYNLSAATHALEKQIKDDKITNAQTKIELDAQKKKIEGMEADLAEILSKESKKEITSPVDGVVEEILFAAGQSCVETDKLMVLNISEDGFTATAEVSAEQNKTLSKGKEAKVVSQGFENAKVTVKSIVKSKGDSSKFTITFTVSGDDVVAGQNLRIELGESASTFDSVVPKGAVKKDSGGSFVYAVKSKSTPLGNRYIVEKVNVTIIAEDDTQCAVSGEFGESADYIITASSKPFSPGDQVRLAEE